MNEFQSYEFQSYDWFWCIISTLCTNMGESWVDVDPSRIFFRDCHFRNRMKFDMQTKMNFRTFMKQIFSESRVWLSSSLTTLSIVFHQKENIQCCDIYTGIISEPSRIWTFYSKSLEEIPSASHVRSTLASRKIIGKIHFRESQWIMESEIQYMTFLSCVQNILQLSPWCNKTMKVHHYIRLISRFREPFDER